MQDHLIYNCTTILLANYNNQRDGDFSLRERWIPGYSERIISTIKNFNFALFHKLFTYSFVNAFLFQLFHICFIFYHLFIMNLTSLLTYQMTFLPFLPMLC